MSFFVFPYYSSVSIFKIIVLQSQTDKTTIDFFTFSISALIELKISRFLLNRRAIFYKTCLRQKRSAIQWCHRLSPVTCIGERENDRPTIVFHSWSSLAPISSFDVHLTRQIWPSFFPYNTLSLQLILVYEQSLVQNLVNNWNMSHDL